MTASNWKYFSKEELRCPCCGTMNMSDAFMRRLVSIRKILDVPMKINSGYRCEEHNKAIGGSKNSTHMKGRAVDISLEGMPEEKQVRLLEEAIRHYPEVGIGVAKTFVHIDNTRTRLWSY